MVSTEKQVRRRRTPLLAGVFAFLFHAVAPYYVSAADSSISGYTTTICTAHGFKTVFVAFDASEQNQAASHYFECPTCIVHANAGGWMEPGYTLFEVLPPPTGERWDGQHFQTPEADGYPPFLIRGPPVRS